MPLGRERALFAMSLVGASRDRYETIVAGGPMDAEVLLQFLATHDVGKASQTLGDIGDRQAVEPLVAALLGMMPIKPDDCDRLIPIAEALGQIGDARAIEALVKAMVDATHRSNTNEFVEAAIVSTARILKDSAAQVSHSALGTVAALPEALQVEVVHGDDDDPRSWEVSEVSIDCSEIIAHANTELKRRAGVVDTEAPREPPLMKT